jgi:hypothetical protein
MRHGATLQSTGMQHLPNADVGWRECQLCSHANAQLLRSPNAGTDSSGRHAPYISDTVQKGAFRNVAERAAAKITSMLCKCLPHAIGRAALHMAHHRKM